MRAAGRAYKAQKLTGESNPGMPTKAQVSNHRISFSLAQQPTPTELRRDANCPVRPVPLVLVFTITSVTVGLTTLETGVSHDATITIVEVPFGLTITVGCWYTNTAFRRT